MIPSGHAPSVIVVPVMSTVDGAANVLVFDPLSGCAETFDPLKQTTAASICAVAPPVSANATVCVPVVGLLRIHA